MKRLAAFLVTPVIKLILRIICRIDAGELVKLPEKGPYLIVTNHVNFLEVPIIYTFLRPRRPYSFIKEETWENRFLGFLANIWDAVPIKRGTADFRAFRAAEKIFRKDGILIIAPEGTRTGNGILRKGHPGAAFIAMYNRVPVYPLSHFGGEQFYSRFRRFRRTPFHIRVGEPFLISRHITGRRNSALRQKITDEIMGRIAQLLPEENRGSYAEEAIRNPEYLCFPGESNG